MAQYFINEIRLHLLVSVAAGLSAVAPPTFAPHIPQNLIPGGRVLPHSVQC